MLIHLVNEAFDSLLPPTNLELFTDRLVVEDGSKEQSVSKADLSLLLVAV